MRKSARHLQRGTRLLLIAKGAFYWNADGIDENGSPTLEDLQSDYYDKRSAAELIAAVLALDKK